MTKTFSRKVVLRCFFSALFSIAVITANTWSVFGQCSSCPVAKANDPNATNQLAFPPGDVYVDIDVRIQGTDEARQIIAGIGSWNQRNQANGSGVNFIIGPPPQTGTYNVLHATNTTLTNPNGSVNHTTVARTVPNRFDNATSTLNDATIYFNTGGALADPDHPDTSGPYYDPTQSGYDSIFQKETEHETGHDMGLSDVDPTCQQSGQSVMNHAIVPGCPNDNCGAKPLTVSQCDSDAVSTVPNYQPQPNGGGNPPPTYGGNYDSGGGGGGCTDYYWVWYESYDGGQTWYETGQVDYAGCW